MNISILGAGLSGLIAATQFPNAVVYEQNGSEALSHRAVLRFRTDVLSRLTGIPFRRITVRKSIWYDGTHVSPNIQLANLYSNKTNGAYLDRSIWNIEPVERFIAPEDLQLQMAEMIGNRIHWNTPVERGMMTGLSGSGPIISTLPMIVLFKLLYEKMEGHPDFVNKAIAVDRYRVTGADVFQTIYFPDPKMAAYRASITGDLLIVERTRNQSQAEFLQILEAFGIAGNMDVDQIDYDHVQRFGKIQPIDDVWRRQAIYNLTVQHNIYSLGRFAIWKNVLLDDVAADVAVVKRLIATGPYGASLQHANKKG